VTIVAAIPEALTFDDVLLVPGKSSILPTETSTQTCVTRKIAISDSAAFLRHGYGHRVASGDRHRAAGWPGVIHRNMTIERQAEEVDRVKRSESGMIVDPVTISPDLSVRQAMEIMAKYRISGLPVTRGTRLVGILTNRDLRF